MKTQQTTSRALDATSLKASPENLMVQDTLRWLERAVIGLNLCPFAKSVYVKGQVHCAVSSVVTLEALRDDLIQELKDLVSLDASVRDTSLLIVQNLLQDFADYNDFLNVADDCLLALDLEGEIQIASFHPHYQFAGTEENDITNFTNRSPYPTLHLIREASIDRAVAAFPEAEAIFEVNMATLNQLGLAGWQALEVGANLPQNESDEKKSS
ncbi:MAG: DUF1415 domain-containing protein [Betaproteobacteria bacterium]|jgi:hypothetical protein|nr:DUF1415 domain-containing protein [Betaproteobacteria bacterium]